MKIAAVTFFLVLAGLVLYVSEAESPRLECLKKCQSDHVACLALAKSDPKERSECNKILSTCEQGCPQN
jgi:hypothetical protein